jgi:hypothetical protein
MASGDEVPSATLRAGLRYAQDDRKLNERLPSLAMRVSAGATTLLGSVKRQESTASRIILSSRHRGRGASDFGSTLHAVGNAASLAEIEITERRQRCGRPWRRRELGGLREPAVDRLARGFEQPSDVHKSTMVAVHKFLRDGFAVRASPEEVHQQEGWNRRR